MGKTVEHARVNPFEKMETIDRLNREIDSLAKKRADAGRFMQIDKEKSDLDKIRKDSVKVKENATKQALDIVVKARIEAESVKNQAIADRDTAKKYAQRVIREAKNKEKLVDMQQDLSTKRAAAVTKMEDAFKRAVDEHEAKVGKMKGKASALTKAILELVGE